MGVHGLWQILEPAHRPVRLETLGRKRLAVDASIWIYQFLKAVRDAEGNALHNSHIVGFFRRICKLLFHGIRPVFVFDGGAPALKRQTIAGRKQRRHDRQEDAAQTARKLLALRVKKRADEEAERRSVVSVPTLRKEEEIPENPVYVDELEQTPDQRKEAQRKRKFEKMDQYQLPEMEHDFSEFGAPNDVRILSTEELQEYARQFEGMEDATIVDYSNIDFNSPFFAALPDVDRYRILNQARLRSRLRMGYSKEQLDAMFPDRMAFSKFQIERVKRRNELSQRMMNLQGSNKDIEIGRVAGERNKEYVMVRNEKHGGWAMSFVGNKGVLEGEHSKPIDVEKLGRPEVKDEESDEDIEFEDVPIEGLNRLPKVQRILPSELAMLRGETAQLRRALYESRLEQSGGRKRQPQDSQKTDSLFLEDGIDDVLFGLEDDDFEDEKDLHEAIAMSLDNGGLYVEDEDLQQGDFEDEEDLHEAIAMSLDNGGLYVEDEDLQQGDFEDEEDLHEAIAMSLDNGRLYVEDEDLQQAIAISMSKESTADHGKGKGRAVETPNSSQKKDNDTDDAEFYLAMAESLKPQFRPGADIGEGSRASSKKIPPKLPGKLDLSKSSSFLLGGRKPTTTSKPPLPLSQKEKPKQSEQDYEVEPVPLPPWFAGGGIRDIIAEIERSKEQTKERLEQHEQSSTLKQGEIVEVLSSDDGQDVEFLDVDLEANRGETKEFSTDDLVERLKAIQPPSGPASQAVASDAINKPARTAGEHSYDEYLPWSDSKGEGAAPSGEAAPASVLEETTKSKALFPGPVGTAPAPVDSLAAPGPPSPILRCPSPSPDETEELNDFDMSFEHEQTPPPEELAPEDVEEDELLIHMQREAEEHARFAAEIAHQNNREQNIIDYEQELKSLRTQQRKDRRDADEVTQVMIQECQHLLTLFGLPYITAPMEAEAQCAELVKLGLVDGIVTDDSDVFLFGGTRVYRHMFNDKQVVQCYLASDFEKEFSLNQNRLVAAAQLLGSDYTEGITNVGPVTAIELLAEFAEEGLVGFKAWWTKVQQGTDTPDESSTRFRKKFKRLNVAKIFLPPSFPDPRIDDAYLHPEVDSDPSAFEWGVPDLEGLRTYLMNTLGWGREKTDQILVPVVKDMNRKEEGSQVNITDFFGGAVGTGAFAPRVRQQAKSSRMEKAMELLKKKGEGAEGGEGSDEDHGQKRPMSMREKFAQEMVEGGDDEEEEVENPPKKKGKKAAPKRKAPAKKGRRKTK